MLQWSDTGIVLTVRKHGEHHAIVSVLTAGHGVHRGVVRHAFSKTRRGVCEPGNAVEARWSARLNEHLGAYQLELIYALSARLLDAPLKLAALVSACALTDTAFPERDPHPALYHGLEALSRALCEDTGSPPIHALAAVAHYELLVLREAGFGLDLRHCAATGGRGDLVYVSPKTGRAVSRDAGRPYHDRLLALPAFLHDSGSVPDSCAAIRSALRLTRFFLERDCLHAPLPAACRRLAGMLAEQEKHPEYP